MTGWTQRIDEITFTVGAIGDRTELNTDIKRIMNEYAIERLEELKGGLPGEGETCETYCTCDAVEDIEAMQRSLKERLAKGGVE